MKRQTFVTVSRNFRLTFRLFYHVMSLFRKRLPVVLTRSFLFTPRVESVVTMGNKVRTLIMQSLLIKQAKRIFLVGSIILIYITRTIVFIFTPFLPTFVTLPKRDTLLVGWLIKHNNLRPLTSLTRKKMPKSAINYVG